MKGVGAVTRTLLTAAGILLLSGCQGFAALDQPPVAKFTVMNLSGESELRVGERVVLDASESKDPQGYALTYEWELKSAQASPVRLSSLSGKTVWFYPDDADSSFYVSLRVTARTQSDVTGLRPILVTAIKQGKIRLTTETDGNGNIEPWGVRALVPNEVFLLNATPKKGFRFIQWIVSGTGLVTIADPAKASTSAWLSPGSGPVTIQARFEPSAAVPQFVGWKKVFPNGLAKVSGDTGLVTADGSGNFSGQMVSLARSPDGLLYAAGSPFSSPLGVQFFTIDAASGMAGLGLDFQYGKTLVTVSSLTYSTAGTLYALEKALTPRLFRVDPATANLTLGIDLLLNGQPVALRSLTSSANTKTLYGTEGAALYQVDPIGVVTRVGSFNVAASLSSLTSTKDGRLFAIDEGAAATTLYSIEPTTGSATLLLPLTAGLLSVLAE